MNKTKCPDCGKTNNEIEKMFGLAWFLCPCGCGYAVLLKPFKGDTKEPIITELKLGRND